MTWEDLAILPFLLLHLPYSGLHLVSGHAYWQENSEIWVQTESDVQGLDRSGKGRRKEKAKYSGLA